MREFSWLAGWLGTRPGHPTLRRERSAWMGVYLATCLLRAPECMEGLLPIDWSIVCLAQVSRIRVPSDWSIVLVHGSVYVCLVGWE